MSVARPRGARSGKSRSGDSLVCSPPHATYVAPGPVRTVPTPNGQHASRCIRPETCAVDHL